MKRTGITLIALLAMCHTAISQIINIPIDQPTIQAGIDSASVGDTVLVADGTYLENINYRGKAITVASQFLLDGDTSHISKTIIDGSQPEYTDSASTVTMLLAMDTTSVLCGFTITGGSGTGEFETGSPGVYTRNGGGIINAGGKIVNNIIRDNHITNNQFAKGGGLSAGNIMFIPADTGINLVIRDNIFYHNSCSTQVHYAGGGGMVIDLMNGINLVENNQIHHNTTFTEAPYKAVAGGMLAGKFTSNTGKGIIRNNHIHHNEAHSQESFGGGIFYILMSDFLSEEFSPTHFYNNIIHSNYSENYGGGISLWYLGYWNFPPPVDPVIFNNTIVGNSSKRGTGISIIDSEVLMFNNILWNNPTDDTGEEVFTDLFCYCPGYSPQWCWNNRCFDQNEAKLHAKFNLIKGGYPGTGNIDVFPLLDSTSFEPSEGSPIIGHGVDSVEINDSWYYAFAHDFYGNPRPNPIDNRVDLGAIESPYEGYVYIPDTAFLDALIEEGADTNGDGLISYAEAEAIISLHVAGINLGFCEPDCWYSGTITSLVGIESFVNLETLDCSGNQLTSLDFSANTALKDLDCSWNLLSSLDVSNNTALTSLSCRENQLTSLDISSSTNLGMLYLSYMTSLGEVCVWETFNQDSVDIATEGSPNICFKTDCNGVCGPTDIEELRKAVISIYPNPAGDLITIETGQPRHLQIEITSLNGQLILSRNMEGSTHQIDLSSFQKGVYCITIRSKDFVTTRKIVKL